jgi:glycosyltransferase involved in cell wall biosynthesis
VVGMEGAFETASRFTAFVHLPRNLGAAEYQRGFLAGIEPDESPYGFHFAREFGADVRFSDCPSSAPTLIGRIVRWITGFDILSSWRSRQGMRDADVIWTMREDQILGAAALMIAGIVPRKPIIGSIIWIANGWQDYGPVRKWAYRRLLEEASCLFVHSEACLEPMRWIAPTVPVALLHFGVSQETFDVQPSTDAYRPDRSAIAIVAAGNDQTRDWDTLVAAFGGDDRFQLTIACSWLNPDRLAGLPNVTVLKPRGTAALPALYRTADFIAVPMHRNLYSGITVALEAALIGVPILSTRTGGVPTYFDEGEAIFVPVGDASAMREAVLRCDAATRKSTAERAKHRAAVNDYTSRGMMRRYVEHTRKYLKPGFEASR